MNLLPFQRVRTVNFLYCRHPRDRELVSLIARVCNSGNLFQSKSVIYFCRGFSCCPYYRGVRRSDVSARRELTVFPYILNYTHFEITGDPCRIWLALNSAIYSQIAPFFALNRILIFNPSKWKWSNKNRILILTIKLCNFKMGVIKW